jgi:hypothetical protein
MGLTLSLVQLQGAGQLIRVLGQNELCDKYQFREVNGELIPYIESNLFTPINGEMIFPLKISDLDQCLKRIKLRWLSICLLKIAKFQKIT